MDEIKLWRTDAERGLQPLDTVAQLETELQLEDILTAHPELLETDLQLVGRQTPAAGGWLDLLGVFAAYRSAGVVEISLGTITEKQHNADYAKLASRVQLSDWPHGGRAIVIENDDQWEQIKPHIREFAAAVHKTWQTYRNTSLHSE